MMLSELLSHSYIQMKVIFALCSLISTLTFIENTYGQPVTLTVNDKTFISPDQDLPNSIFHNDNRKLADTTILKLIYEADKKYSIEQLAAIVTYCSNQKEHSLELSMALSNWLRENHSIYVDKSPTEVNQFRGFLMFSLSMFPPNDILYGYIKNELLFSAHTYSIASAAHTARIFTSEAQELVLFLNQFLQNSFPEVCVDISTYKLDYPLVNPTKARYEIIKTLRHFGANAYPSVKLLHDILERESQKLVNQDTILISLLKPTIESILNATPLCCRKEIPNSEPLHPTTGFIEKNERKRIHASDLSMFDQNGNKMKFDKLTGKPFVLTFFYTSCTNPLKCASTVGRLGKLQEMTVAKKISDKVGIYAMTYDPDFDSPTMIKSYGEVYGVSFSKTVRFLVAQDKSEQNLFAELDLRVNYGYGSVNQHGVQLFLIDKKGRIASTYDNELWTVDDVYNALIYLTQE